MHVVAGEMSAWRGEINAGVANRRRMLSKSGRSIGNGGVSSNLSQEVAPSNRAAARPSPLPNFFKIPGTSFREARRTPLKNTCAAGFPQLGRMP
jgi:hypothetical protein